MSAYYLLVLILGSKRRISDKLKSMLQFSDVTYPGRVTEVCLQIDYQCCMWHTVCRILYWFLETRYTVKYMIHLIWIITYYLYVKYIDFKRTICMMRCMYFSFMKCQEFVVFKQLSSTVTFYMKVKYTLTIIFQMVHKTTRDLAKATVQVFFRSGAIFPFRDPWWQSNT